MSHLKESMGQNHRCGTDQLNDTQTIGKTEQINRNMHQFFRQIRFHFCCCHEQERKHTKLKKNHQKIDEESVSQSVGDKRREIESGKKQHIFTNLFA